MGNAPFGLALPNLLFELRLVSALRGKCCGFVGKSAEFFGFWPKNGGYKGKG